MTELTNGDSVDLLRVAITESHRYRELREQKDSVIEAARRYLNANMDGESLPLIIGAQSALEFALLRLDDLIAFEAEHKIGEGK